MSGAQKATDGLFITLEGGEGVGKSTLAAGLKSALEAQGDTVEQTREPGGTPLAEAVRGLVLQPDEPLSPMAQALLINAARADHIDKRIRPALDRGHIVICDRFSDSTLAYQSVSGEISFSTLQRLDAARLQGMAPDITFVLDAAPEHVLARRQSRGTSADVFEAKDLAFHETVRANFLSIAKAEPERCIVLDALQPAEQLLDEALSRITEKRKLFQAS